MRVGEGAKYLENGLHKVLLDNGCRPLGDDIPKKGSGPFPDDGVCIYVGCHVYHHLLIGAGFRTQVTG